MIRKTLLLSLGLIIIFIFVTNKFITQSLVSQDQWQENSIKAQGYLYLTNDSGKSIILGSSLANRLVMDSLPGFTNLAFGGLSIFDGLDILMHKNELPRSVYIEINLVLRPEAKDFSGSLFNPILYVLREEVPALRDGNQPVARVGSLLLSSLKKLTERLSVSFNLIKSDQHNLRVMKSEVNGDESDNDNGTFFSKLLQMQIKAYSLKPDSVSLVLALNNLDAYVRRLEEKNVRVVFFEMPVNPALCGLPLAVGIRTAFYNKFPRKIYNYMPGTNCSGYLTKDGIHLNNKDAMKFTRYFREASQ